MTIISFRRGKHQLNTGGLSITLVATVAIWPWFRAGADLCCESEQEAGESGEIFPVDFRKFGRTSGIKVPRATSPDAVKEPASLR